MESGKRSVQLASMQIEPFQETCIGRKDGVTMDGSDNKGALNGIVLIPALCSMESPSVKDVVSQSAMEEATATPEPVGYYNACSLAVPTKRLSTASAMKSECSQGEQREEQNERRKKNRKKIVISVLVVISIAASWTGATQFSKSSLTSPTFRAPYFLIWFNTNWMTACFPTYLLIVALVSACSRNTLSKSPYRQMCDSCLVFGPSGLTPKAIFTRSVLFTTIWTIANYSYGQALMHISAAETTIVFSSNIAFVYFLSWVFLHDRFLALRTIAMLLAIVGIVLMVYAEGIGTITFIGVVCAVIASAGSAVYKVLFKKVIGDANFGQVSLFMSFLGLCNLLFSCPVMLALTLTGAETADWNNMPWWTICGSATLGLLFNLLVNVGVAYTSPIYVSIGVFLGLPINAAVDAIWRGVVLNGLQLGGGAFILCSFFILMLPDDFASLALRRLGMRQ